MTKIQRIRVPVGLAYAGLFLILAQPQPASYAAGLLMVAVGLSIRVWAAGHLEKFHRLAVGGPYLWTRNPLYFGSFLIGIGFTIAGDRLWLVLLFGILFFAIYLPVMSREETELAEAYGADYQKYRRSVPRFFPFPKRHSSLRLEFSQQRFRWRRVIENREHHAVAGCLILALILTLKMMAQS